MLGQCKCDQITLDARPSKNLPYEVMAPRIEIVDEMTARFTATFNGPPDSQVIGRAWISDEDGTMVDGETGLIDSGTSDQIVLTIPKSKTQNGNLIACMRVEWPVFQTKHVIGWTLLEGDIVHPPKGKQCE